MNQPVHHAYSVPWYTFFDPPMAGQPGRSGDQAIPQQIGEVGLDLRFWKKEGKGEIGSTDLLVASQCLACLGASPLLVRLLSRCLASFGASPLVLRLLYR